VVAVVSGGRLYREAVAELLDDVDCWQVHRDGPDPTSETAGLAAVVVVGVGPDASAPLAPIAGVPSVVVACDGPSWAVNHSAWAAGRITVVDGASPGARLVAAVAAAVGVRHDRPGLRSPPQQPASGIGRLTRREAEILRLTAGGARTPQVAAHLGISPHTVRTHLQSCMAKLEAHSRAEMVSVARAAGLEPDPAGTGGGSENDD